MRRRDFIASTAACATLVVTPLAAGWQRQWPGGALCPCRAGRKTAPWP